MWGIKAVLGLQIDQVYELKDGKNIAGRHESCDIHISHTGISRKHFEILLRNNEFILKDLNSVNGTFVNGVLIEQPTLLSPGDKISCNDIIFEFNKTDHLKHLHENPEISHIHPSPILHPETLHSQSSLQENIHGNLAVQNRPQELALTEENSDSTEKSSTSNSSLTPLQNYFENVVMPGIYRLAQWGEFRWVLGGFVLIYIILITLLSVFPLMQISRERILKESQLRAVEITKNLAKNYRNAIRQGLSSTFVVKEERLPGVDTAMIISANDGHILAPARKIGAHADLPFIHKAREQDTLVVEELQDNMIGVSVPIRTINPETGDSIITAFSILIYNVSFLKNEDIVRLVVQVLAFAFLIGLILFILLYKLIEYPIRELNLQIDKALKSGDSEIEINFKYPAIQKLITNIKSALSRITQAEDINAPSPEVGIEEEAQGLIQLIKTEGLILDASGTIIATNPQCDSLIAEHDTLLNKNISDMTDQALQLNLQDLFQRALSQQGQLVENELEFSGVNYTIEAMTILSGSTSKFVVVTFSNQEAEGDF